MQDLSWFRELLERSRKSEASDPIHSSHRNGLFMDEVPTQEKANELSRV